MTAYETPLRAPKTPDYRPNLDDNMDSFPDPNLDSESEETPPASLGASQLEPRHKNELAKQNDYKGKHLAQENLPRNSQSKQTTTVLLRTPWILKHYERSMNSLLNYTRANK